MSQGIFVLLLISGGAVFNTWRAVMVARRPDLFEPYAQQEPLSIFSPRFRRGMVRGSAPMAVASWALAAFMCTAVVMGGRTAVSADSLLIAAIPLAVLVAGFLMAISVAAFNRPKWCVPRYLRDEPGAWSKRAKQH
ncbi:hypothetical protein PUR71_08015 [Streptomyces sp. SP17BM10]|uniref:hypothetical protein n=1 Tax=Streptomyces sp. SP17BM10 TaxID=3002530 RepID=UPI002E76F7FF|nr:hypothetical protein [Streptomyces sp. SP17BM10]MEE1782860.1 hypothetical protein [Streptomyces sp. SP17BM10]